nr:hypothetical protein MFMH1_34190 [Myxococcus sp. MH1]
MSYRELLSARFQVRLREEQQATRQRIGDDDESYRARGGYGSGPHVTSGAQIYIEGVERLVVGILKELRQESMQLSPRAFAELWESAGSCLDEQMKTEFRRRKLTLKSALEQRGRWDMSMEMVVGQMFEQHASNLRLDVHHRIEEAKHSYVLLTVPSRPPTNELLVLVEEVKKLVAAQGDVSAFLSQNAPRLDRIESEIKRVGLDVEFAADVLTQQLGDKLTNRGAISQFLSGVSTNAGYDVIKSALGALSGLAGG